MNAFSALIQWNQTFSFILDNGLEKIQVFVFITPIVFKQIEIEKLEIDLESLLPKLMD